MKEITGEWVIGNKVPFVNGHSIQVQTTFNDVRTVIRRPTLDFSSLWFTDCQHPAQNAYCAESNIVAWRIVPQFSASALSNSKSEPSHG
jgi:hypothetical protein